MGKYDDVVDDKKPVSKKDIGSYVDELIRKSEKLDETNPLERSKKFKLLKQNIPDPGIMKVDCYEVKDEYGVPKVISISKDFNGKIQKIPIDPFFTVDLNALLQADITSCPSSVMPMMIDEHVQIALAENKDWKPEKVKKEFNWWWLLFFLLPVPAILLWLFGFFG